MKLFGWAVELSNGSVGFALRKVEILNTGVKPEQVFPVYRVESELINPVAEATQPGETENGPRTS